MGDLELDDAVRRIDPVLGGPGAGDRKYDRSRAQGGDERDGLFHFGSALNVLPGSILRTIINDYQTKNEDANHYRYHHRIGNC